MSVRTDRLRNYRRQAPRPRNVSWVRLGIRAASEDDAAIVAEIVEGGGESSLVAVVRLPPGARRFAPGSALRTARGPVPIVSSTEEGLR